MLDAVQTVFLIEVDDDLDVAVGSKARASVGSGACSVFEPQAAARITQHMSQGITGQILISKN